MSTTTTKEIPTRERLFTLLTLVGLLGVVCGGAALEAQSPCSVQAAWFPHGATQKPDFDQTFGSLCSIHQWAIQEFLYLTQEPGAGLARFLHLASPHALFIPDPKHWPPPHPYLPPHCVEGTATPATGAVFLPRAAKSDEDFSAIHQAGSGDVLVDQQGQPVYFSAHVNETYYSFVRGNHYNTAKGANAASPGTEFPVGSLELKSAWRVAKDADRTYIPDASDRFYTIDAYVQPPGKSCVVDATLALVGLHVVGRVNGHPELIWATFEHQDNAPDCKDTPATGVSWSFYEAGTRCGQGPDSSSCNQGKSTFTSTPSEVCQVNPWGQPGVPDPDNTDDVLSLNQGLHNNLASDDVWRNYEYGGAIWTTGATDSSNLLVINSKTIVGSTKLANTSLESFTQTQSCFDCHGTFAPGGCLEGQKNIFLSHLFALTCESSKPEPGGRTTAATRRPPALIEWTTTEE